MNQAAISRSAQLFAVSVLVALPACGSGAQSGSNSGVEPANVQVMRTAGVSSANATWSPKAPLPQARDALLLAAVNGSLVAASGDNASGTPLQTYAYNPTLNQWTLRAPMPIGVSFAGMGVITVAGSEIAYVVGGGTGPGFTPSPYLQAYDLHANAWTMKANLPTPRLYPAVAAIAQRLYVIGGSVTNPTNIVEAYDPATNTWESRAPLPQSAFAASAAAIGSTLYVVGAGAGIGNNLTYAYNATTNAWTARAPSPMTADYAGAAAVNGLLYVVGGQGSARGGKSGTVQIYNPSTNTWSTGTSLPSPVDAEGVAALNNTIYEAAGQNGFFQDIGTMDALTP